MTSPARTLDVATPDGARLRAFVEGKGPDLLLVSGLGGTAAFWDGATQALSAHFRVIRLDQRGIGASTRGAATCTIAQLALDCITVLNAAETDRAAILGHSTGGCIAMTVAAHMPQRVTKLVLSATWARQNRHMEALFGARLSLLAETPQAYASLACLMSYPPEWLEANWHVHDLAVAKAELAPGAAAVVRERIEALLAFDGQSIVPALAMPCLVLGARDDLIVPFYLQENVRAGLKSADFHFLETGGHFFPHTREEWFVREVKAFLNDGG